MDIYLLAYLLCGATALRLLVVLYRAATSPLRRVPGPLLARFTDGWYFWRLYLGSFNVDNQRLHAEYGSYSLLPPALFPFPHSTPPT
ncbi:hypothetical protein IMZ48_21935 [Candidatus Bathyarchaeota archaeon]|nr:hypothetical protein [Candidatus Bathyarchaeota archaeon]